MNARISLPGKLFYCSPVAPWLGQERVRLPALTPQRGTGKVAFKGNCGDNELEPLQWMAPPCFSRLTFKDTVGRTAGINSLYYGSPCPCVLYPSRIPVHAQSCRENTTANTTTLHVPPPPPSDTQTCHLTPFLPLRRL